MKSEIRNPKSGNAGGWPWIKRALVALAVVFAVRPASVLACAACYGASDSPMAKGMNWGIFSLLGVVTVVLGCIATFFVFIGKRSAEASHLPEADSAKTEPTEKA
jgi:NhaP-type Na+/H+ or K+/H+ antiporter